jgi:hypothetical protein
MGNLARKFEGRGSVPSVRSRTRGAIFVPGLHHACNGRFQQNGLWLCKPAANLELASRATWASRVFVAAQTPASKLRRLSRCSNIACCIDTSVIA